jgi:predicted anti-sigma-YlaC factor YlaD
MSSCDEVREELFLRREPTAAAAAHLQSCPRCRQYESVAGNLARALDTEPAPKPPPGLTTQVLAAAKPLMAAHAAAAQPSGRTQIARAITAALLPLPVIVLVFGFVLRGAYLVLSTIFPTALSTYLVFNYAALLALVITLTYAAVPLLADRQARLARQESLPS